MARNEVYKVGSFVSLPVPTGKKSGDPIRVGSLNGVLQTNEASLDIPSTPASPYVQAPSSNRPGFASVALEGAFKLPVSTTTTRAVGDPVYITSGGTLTTTDNSGANALFGHALEPKGATANQLITVRIAN